MSKAAVATLAGIAGVAAIVSTQVPEVRRYLKIRKM